MTNSTEEIITGYLVDLACIRRFPKDEMIERGINHTLKCATMGHCVESGYGIIDETGQVTVLDTKATPLVFKALNSIQQKRGIQLCATRRNEEDEMKTVAVNVLQGTNESI